MSYVDQEYGLNQFVATLPLSATIALSDSDLTTIIEETISEQFEITFGEIGEICELVRQVIAKEWPPEGFTERLKAKLDEDNQPKAADVVAALSEKIFAKLLPALGIKVPLEMAVRPKPKMAEKAPAPAAGAGAESARPALRPMPPPTVPANLPTGPDASHYQGPSLTNDRQGSALIKTAARTVPLKKFPTAAPSPAPSPRPPLRSVSVHQVYEGPSIASYQNQSDLHHSLHPTPRPPIIETSHSGLSANPLQSLMQMLSDRVTPKELAKHFEILPPELKQALQSVDSAKKVVDIGRKHALHIDQIGELGAETGMVILGFTHPDQFLRRVSRRLDLPEDKTRAVAEEINTEIFLKIREALKEVHGEGELATGTSSAPAKFNIDDKNTDNAPPVPKALHESGFNQGGALMENAGAEMLNRRNRPAPVPPANLPAADSEITRNKPSDTPPVASPKPYGFGDKLDELTVKKAPPPKTDTDESEGLDREALLRDIESSSSAIKLSPTPPVSAPPATPQTPSKPTEPGSPASGAKKPPSGTDAILSGPTIRNTSESRYSVDPYRESTQ